MDWTIEQNKLPLTSSFECSPAEPAVDTFDVDDRTMDYVVASRPHYNNLNKAIAQVAGLLVLGAAGGRCPPDHPMMSVAEELHITAHQSLGRLRVTPRAAHHHRHLQQASCLVADAVSETKAYLRLRDERVLDAATHHMNAAYQELLVASRCLPGFEVVALGDGCCGGHGGLKRREPEKLQYKWREA